MQDGSYRERVHHLYSSSGITSQCKLLNVVYKKITNEATHHHTIQSFPHYYFFKCLNYHIRIKVIIFSNFICKLVLNIDAHCRQLIFQLLYSNTKKCSHHDIAEILLKLASNTNQSITVTPGNKQTMVMYTAEISTMFSLKNKNDNISIIQLIEPIY